MSTPKPRFFLGKSKGLSGAPGGRPSSSSSARASPAAAKPPPPPADAPIALDGDTRLAEYSSPDDVCPVCKNDRYLNPKLRLMVSKCYHKMCESCLDRLFSLGPEPCPICGQTIRKAQFQPQIFQNLEVQKEVAVRRRMAKIFNKRPEDFPTPSAYNDYLETYESLTFSLIHSIGSDLAATEAKIRAYELQNRQSIEDNEERLVAEKEAHEGREKKEREKREEERRKAVEEQREEEREKEEERRRVVAELEKGDLPASEILAASAARARSSALKRSSQRGGTPSAAVSSALDASADSAFARLQSLSSLGGASASPSIPSNAAPFDPRKYLARYTAATPLFTLAATPQAYSAQLGSLVKERERGDEAGFKAEEVWEKAVRLALVGMWEAPIGWDEGGANGGGGAAPMEVEVA
ncbi:hypothetical protein JCM10207_002175 [Rhodosporidiobolus poonsookiae]